MRPDRSNQMCHFESCRVGLRRESKEIEVRARIEGRATVTSTAPRPAVQVEMRLPDW
jgi:hypothetical protein